MILVISVLLAVLFIMKTEKANPWACGFLIVFPALAYFDFKLIFNIPALSTDLYLPLSIFAFVCGLIGGLEYSSKRGHWVSIFARSSAFWQWPHGTGGAFILIAGAAPLLGEEFSVYKKGKRTNPNNFTIFLVLTLLWFVSTKGYVPEGVLSLIASGVGAGLLISVNFNYFLVAIVLFLFSLQIDSVFSTFSMVLFYISLLIYSLLRLGILLDHLRARATNLRFIDWLQCRLVIGHSGRRPLDVAKIGPQSPRMAESGTLWPTWTWTFRS